MLTGSRRVLGKFELLCYERQIADLRLARAPGGHPRGLIWSRAHGQRVVDFIERYCSHYKGEWAGRPLILAKWQRRLLRMIFGWYRADGTRRYRSAYVEVPRKNGKSTLAAGCALYLLIADDEPGAEIYSTATKYDQASIVWKDAVQMVKKSRALARHATPGRKSIACEKRNSEFRPLGADGDTLDGLNPHANVVDELHAHKTRTVWDVMQSAMGSRRQPLTLAITTAGRLDLTSVGFEQHTYAEQLLEGVIEDDSTFAFIAACDEGDDYFGDLALEKANPNIDLSLKRSYLHERAAKARAQPSEFSEFVTKHLNVWTTASSGWVAHADWKACDPEPVAREEFEAALAGLECKGGLDLSSKLDMTALALEFDTPTGRASVLRYWLPRARLDVLVKQRGAKFYSEWERNGWLLATPGNVVDYDLVREEIERLAKIYKITEIAFDPYNATQLSTQLQAAGFLMIECKQGARTLHEPIKDLEADVAERRLRHGGNPILAWNVNNAVIKTEASGLVQLDKGRAKGRIDGLAALVMARSRLIAGEQIPKSPYEERGFLSL